ncbi:acetylornithine transaminase [Lipingzhangella sp. LS1_29]|uniref:Acetylornithine aminotransferase n=1 Tax=Lipingzhangella rawalii TaxID=2055835 RepID=A0ABU2H7V1_9ACTN|nr:acetylornithine transaminase [Lipingzhangella rawalii]MDS1271388.1 acetylornithine transaminase [Lipingzhangella rawalii]
MSATEQLRERFARAMMPTYGTPDIALAQGRGCRVRDVDGNEYLDLVAGIAVSALGHGHPALVRAVADQAAHLAHTSNLYIHEPGVQLAERLVRLVAPDGNARVFLTNSGTEAMEAALKLVRRAAGPERSTVVATTGGFHGRSTGALAITGKAAIRDPFGPFGVDVRFVDYGDTAALRAAVDETCAAVVVEPVQGEAGVVPPPENYLHTVRQVCTQTGALFVLDEVQSGIGRTGTWFAYQDAGPTPDVLTLAKGLGGGLPIGACVGLGDAATALAKGDHGSTFGGNPVACAAALAVLDTIEDQDLLTNASERGGELARGLRELEHPRIASVRGRGLWLGVELAQLAASDVQVTAARHGFLVNAVAADTLRLAPPLTISTTEIQEFIAAFSGILNEASHPSPGGPDA